MLERQSSGRIFSRHVEKLVLIITSICAIIFVDSAYALEWTGNIHVKYGCKHFAENWEQVNKHEAYGVEIDLKYGGMPFSIILEYLKSEGNGVDSVVSDHGHMSWKYDVKVKTEEYNLGVRKTWEIPHSLHPYINGGMSFISARGAFVFLNSYLTEIDDCGIGAWFGGGMYYKFKEHYNVGMDVKVTSAGIDHQDKDLNAGGSHMALSLGYHF